MQRTRIVAALATTMGLALAVSACGSNTTPSAFDVGNCRARLRWRHPEHPVKPAG